VFRVRVLATQEENALIAKAARKQGLSVSQFVTRVIRKLGRKLNPCKIAPVDQDPPDRNGHSAKNQSPDRYRTVLPITKRVVSLARCILGPFATARIVL